MEYFHPFEKFDPLTGDVPVIPYFSLPVIADRARGLLGGRTSAQVRAAASNIDFLIHDYFHVVEEMEIARLLDVLKQPRNWRRISAADEREYRYAEQFCSLLPAAHEHDESEWVFNEDMVSELDIPTPDNTREVDALRACVEWYGPVGGNAFSDEQPHESFSVFALWKVADAIGWIRRVEAADTVDAARSQTAAAGERALEAMEAVDHAVHLSALVAAHASMRESRALDEAQKRAEAARKLNDHRHRRHHELRARVSSAWEEKRNDFPSAEKAGLYFANWLVEQGLTKNERGDDGVAPRTVTGWIRSHARDLGVKFR